MKPRKLCRWPMRPTTAPSPNAAGPWYKRAFPLTTGEVRGMERVGTGEFDEFWRQAIAASDATRAEVEREFAERFPLCHAAGLWRKYPTYAGREDRANVPDGMSCVLDGYGGAPADEVEAFLCGAQPKRQRELFEAAGS